MGERLSSAVGELALGGRFGAWCVVGWAGGGPAVVRDARSGWYARIRVAAGPLFVVGIRCLPTGVTGP